MTSQGASAAPQWADAGGGAWEVVSTHVLSGSTSIITDNGWSNAYARYMMVYDDVYYGGTDFRVVFRVFQDATSGNAGTLLTGNHYLAGGSRAETWSSSENYYTNTGVSYRLGTGATNCPYWTGHMYFSMQTDPATNRQGWYGQTFAGGNAYAYDAGLLSSLTQATHLTGVRLYFVTNTGDADSGNAVNPTQGRVTFLRMKYS